MCFQQNVNKIKISKIYPCADRHVPYALLSASTYIEKNTQFKFKEMLKTAPSCCKILQNHPFVTCWLSDRAISFHLCNLQVPQFSGQIGHHLPEEATERTVYRIYQSTWYIPDSCWKFQPQKPFFF